MKHTQDSALYTLAGLLLLPLLLVAQAPPPPDYLTEEEVKKVREAQEPNKRILLFLEIAAARLAKFEQALAAPPPAHTDDLIDMIDGYISAIDDATSNLEIWLERGGVDLNQARRGIDKRAAALLAQLEKINTSYKERLEEFRLTWDDSGEATRELLEAANNIPEGTIPAKPPARVGTEVGKPEPGRPTLRKKGEAPKPPPQPPPTTGRYGPA
ncbi:MAG: hypothetical protein ACE5MH_03665 [Terriglobia bacterium]